MHRVNKTASVDLATVKSELEVIGQTAALRFVAELDTAGQQQLLKQIASLDLASVPELVAKYVTGVYTPPTPASIEPITPLAREAQTPEQTAMYAKAMARGRELLAEGKVGAFLVAGGQGTRLGYDGPKGEYPVTPLRNKPLFQVFAEQLLSHSIASGKTIPWYIMTSDTNDAATRAFFKKHDYFGYDAGSIFFFQQGMMPAFGMDGQLLLGAKDSLALSPGGNGDCFRSLAKSGALADMQRRKLEHVSYFNVDNPMVHCIDELFLGLHDLTGSGMSSKAVAKAGWDERVGNFCRANGKVQIVEYSDLPAEVARRTRPDGSLAFASASIAIHAIRVDFIARLNEDRSLALPWHKAVKKVPFVDEAGKLVKPEKPNAVKLEQFVFDAIPLAENPLVYTTDRAEEFSPVKNAEGQDSPATSQRDQVRRAARWLMAAGVQVPFKDGEVDAVIEISPLYAATQEQLLARKPRLTTIAPGGRVYIGEDGVQVG